jgi:glycosyltransferase
LHSDDLFAYSVAVIDIVTQLKSSNYDAIFADLQYVSKDETDKVIRLWKSGVYFKENKEWVDVTSSYFLYVA